MPLFSCPELTRLNFQMAARQAQLKENQASWPVYAVHLCFPYSARLPKVQSVRETASMRTFYFPQSRGGSKEGKELNKILFSSSVCPVPSVRTTYFSRKAAEEAKAQPRQIKHLSFFA
jgi:hypothetical protein